MQTFSQIETDVFTQLKEAVGDTGFWIRDEVKAAINDTYMFIADSTECFKLEEIIEVRAGIRVYKLPSNYILGSLYRVEFNKKVIFPISAAELDAHSRSWRNTESSEIKNYIPPGDICATDEIAVYPKPDTDGSVYNLASESKDYGVITTVGDDSYEEFTQEEGTIVATNGEVQFNGEETGVVIDIKDPTNNLRIFAAKYPKRLFNDKEIFLHPISDNPRKILTSGSLAILLAKEGEGKDIQKASFHNKRFNEKIKSVFNKPKSKRIHRMRSISDISIGNSMERGNLNLGENYPSYFMR